MKEQNSNDLTAPFIDTVVDPSSFIWTADETGYVYVSKAQIGLRRSLWRTTRGKAGYLRTDVVLQAHGHTADVAHRVVQTATTTYAGDGGGWLWVADWDFLLFNIRNPFEYTEKDDPIHLDRKYETLQEAFHGLKPDPWDEAQWRTQRERVMQHLIEYRFNGNTALQASLRATYPWPLVAITADQFWGYDIHTCQGENTLGKLLQAYRTTIVMRANGIPACPRKCATKVVQMFSTETYTHEGDYECIARIHRNMQSVNIVLRIEVTGATVVDLRVRPSCKFTQDGPTSIEVCIPDLHSRGDVAENLAFTLVPTTTCSTLCYQLQFCNVDRKRPEFLTACVTFPHCKLDLPPPNLYHNVRNGFVFAYAIQKVGEVQNDQWRQKLELNLALLQILSTPKDELRDELVRDLRKLVDALPTNERVRGGV